MSQIIQKGPETRKLLNFNCLKCNFNLRTHFKTIKCLKCNQEGKKSPKRKINKKNKIGK